MFPRPDRLTHPAHGWLDAIRHGLDLVVAFATLRDAETPVDARETASADRPALTAAAGASSPAAPRAIRPAAPQATRSAPPHPHRRPLRTSTRPRRPGA